MLVSLFISFRKEEKSKNDIIDKLKNDGDKLKISTIKNAPPKSICGSGLIDAIALLLDEEIIDETGYMDDDYELADLRKTTVRAILMEKNRSKLTTEARSKPLRDAIQTEVKEMERAGQARRRYCC